MELRIRPYTESRDYGYIERWIDDERMHALWCANLIPYPVTPENLRSLLEKNAAEWADCAYIVTDSNGENIGFFCYSVNADENTGFLKFIIIDRDKRGMGYGREMLKLALKHAFDITGVKLVRLNVFDENAAAKHFNLTISDSPYEYFSYYTYHIMKHTNYQLKNSSFGLVFYAYIIIISRYFTADFKFSQNTYNYLKNPLIISSSASFSVSPSVINFIICSPAIFPIAAS